MLPDPLSPEALAAEEARRQAEQQTAMQPGDWVDAATSTLDVAAMAGPDALGEAVGGVFGFVGELLGGLFST